MTTITFRAGKHKDGPEITVDASDWPMVCRHTWTVWTPARSKTSYAKTTVRGSMLLLHRALLKAAPDEQIDHIDGNGLNNSRSNLRFSTQPENMESAHRMPGRYQSFSRKNVVRARLKDGTVRTYVYDRKGTSGEQESTKLPAKPRT